MISNDFPDDPNESALRRMRENGDDLAKPRTVEFTVVFGSQSQVDAFARKLRALGYAVSVHESGIVAESPWDAIVQREMVPSHAEITQFERRLASLAEPFEGRNDGWGCFVTPTRSRVGLK